MALPTQAQQAQPDLFFPKRIIPLEVREGSPEIGKRLRELWEYYEPGAKQQFAWEKDFQTNNSGKTNLWQAVNFGNPGSSAALVKPFA